MPTRGKAGGSAARRAEPREAFLVPKVAKVVPETQAARRGCCVEGKQGFRISPSAFSRISFISFSLRTPARNRQNAFSFISRAEETSFIGKRRSKSSGMASSQASERQKKAGPFIDADQRQEAPAGSGRIARSAGIFAILDSPKSSLYNPPRAPLVTRTGANAQVAQLVEHVTENHGVGGSIPPLGTIALSAQPCMHRHPLPHRAGMWAASPP
jgi:hypothetical protein